MTDDLVKRLRETTHMYQVDCELKMKCADRIEELEAENAELKAKVAKAVDALQFLKYEIWSNPFPNEDRIFSKCNTALAELTGGKDD